MFRIQVCVPCLLLLLSFAPQVRAQSEIVTDPIEDGVRLVTNTGRRSLVNAIAVSNDGARIVTADENSVVLWDSVTWTPLLDLPARNLTPLSHASTAPVFAFTTQGDIQEALTQIEVVRVGESVQRTQHRFRLSQVLNLKLDPDGESFTLAGLAGNAPMIMSSRSESCLLAKPVEARTAGQWHVVSVGDGRAVYDLWSDGKRRIAAVRVNISGASSPDYDGTVIVDVDRCAMISDVLRAHAVDAKFSPDGLHVGIVEETRITVHSFANPTARPWQIPSVEPWTRFTFGCNASEIFETPKNSTQESIIRRWRRGRARAQEITAPVASGILLEPHCKHGMMLAAARGRVYELHLDPNQWIAKPFEGGTAQPTSLAWNSEEETLSASFHSPVMTWTWRAQEGLRRGESAPLPVRDKAAPVAPLPIENGTGILTVELTKRPADFPPEGSDNWQRLVLRSSTSDEVLWSQDLRFRGIAVSIGANRDASVIVVASHFAEHVLILRDVDGPGTTRVVPLDLPLPARGRLDGPSTFLIPTPALQFEFFPDGKRLLIVRYRDFLIVPLDHPENAMAIPYRETGAFTPHRELAENPFLGARARLAAGGDGIYFGFSNGHIQAYDTNGNFLWVMRTGAPGVGNLLEIPETRLMLFGSSDGAIRIWDYSAEPHASTAQLRHGREVGRELARVIVHSDGSWLVVDPDGRFDASDPANVEGAVWMRGLEPIAFDQLKDRFYDPGLLSKKLGFRSNDPLREVVQVVDVKPAPSLEILPRKTTDTTVSLRVRDRGGGIGVVAAKLNGREIYRQRPEACNSASECVVTLNLDEQTRFTLPGTRTCAEDDSSVARRVWAQEGNCIDVRAYDARGLISSRGEVVPYVTSASPPATRPKLWAVLVGSNYDASPELQLSFPEKDVRAMHAAIEAIAAKDLFPGGVEVFTLSTGDACRSPACARPVRDNIQNAFRKISDAKSGARAGDLLLVYLSGHGVVHGSSAGDYYYLTSNARSLKLDDDTVRSLDAISATELTRWLNEIPALKRVVILDTCAAGSGAASFLAGLSPATRGDAAPSWQQIALEQLRERSGTHLLASNTGNRASYEASEYGHGVLTYALLRAISESSRPVIDVADLFQQVRNSVPQFARATGVQQVPMVRSGDTFPVGVLPAGNRDAYRAAVGLRLKPLPSLQSVTLELENEPIDQLGLGPQVVDEIERKTRGSAASFRYFEYAQSDTTIRLGSRYRVENGKARLTSAVIYRWRNPAARLDLLPLLPNEPMTPAQVATAITDALEKLANQGTLLPP